MARFPNRHRPAWLTVLHGRDLMTGDGYKLTLLLIARPDLLGPEDEGRMIPVGLEITVKLRRPYHPQIFQSEFYWRWPVVIDVRSDAEEIALRLAGEW